jgi:26S proteasome regulatory subunit N7
LVDSLKEKNEKFLADIDTKLKDAEENLGESDVSELWRSRAMYLCRIGDKVSCIKWIAVMSIS